MSAWTWSVWKFERQCQSELEVYESLKGNVSLNLKCMKVSKAMSAWTWSVWKFKRQCQPELEVYESLKGNVSLNLKCMKVWKAMSVWTWSVWKCQRQCQPELEVYESVKGNVSLNLKCMKVSKAMSAWTWSVWKCQRQCQPELEVYESVKGNVSLNLKCMNVTYVCSLLPAALSRPLTFLPLYLPNLSSTLSSACVQSVLTPIGCLAFAVKPSSFGIRDTTSVFVLCPQIATAKTPIWHELRKPQPKTNNTEKSPFRWLLHLFFSRQWLG